jgi:nucleotidyltransferase AbiEii toxin of type IV toxin-antitoxin system
MENVLEAALEAQRVLAGAGERFCIIGGLALQRWGRPRVTQDVDLTLLCPFGAEAAAAERLLAKFAPRIPDAAMFATRNRVLLMRTSGGVALDVAFGGLPYEERCVARSSDWQFAPGTPLRTCSAEDLVVLKAFASRPQDWLDIETVADRQRRVLDWDLVLEELAPLAAARELPESVERVRRIRDER